MVNKLLLYFFFLCTFIWACVPSTEEVMTDVSIDIQDANFKKLYDLQDKQFTDSLNVYFNDKNPAFRFAAANAFASMKDKKGIDSLAKLLYDPIIEVRANAAYALGQIGDENAVPHLLDAFRRKDTLDVNNIFNASILEAIGKVGDEALLQQLATVKTYRQSDTLLLEGLTRGIYRYLLRGITVPEATERMIEYLTEDGYPAKVQLMAAHYLSRAQGIDLSSAAFRLVQKFNTNEDPAIQMHLAIALGKTNNEAALNALKDQLENETDYRVRCNIIRALENFRYIDVVELVLKQLNDPNIHVARTAANFLVNKGNRNDALIYRDYLNDSLHWEVRSKISASILKHLPLYYINTRRNINTDILEYVNTAAGPYEKAAYIHALSYDPFNYNVVYEQSFNDTSAPVRTMGINALGNILRHEQFVRAHGTRGSQNVKVTIVDFLKQACESGDVAMMAAAAGILRDPQLELKEIIGSPAFMKVARQKLTLPGEIETYNEISATIDYLEDRNHVPKKLDYNHPINWNLLKNVNDSTVAVLKTNKGNIKIQLLPSIAPGSVANFIDLSNSNFYDGKTVHRVVPNFVIQGGCPRGDGYGGLNYSIRSELPQIYYDGEGYVGMASAGNHTECTQWFITHSATPHLDGRYTIFGKVSEGMDIVHDIQVGDFIQDVIFTRM